MASESLPLLLHLDLKGAVPSLSYLERLLTLLKSHKLIDGLLIEYEDSFPYRSSSLKVSVAPVPLDVQRLLRLAEHLELSVVPLFQTLGHMEYLLKEEVHKEYRENVEYVDTHVPLISECQLNDPNDPMLICLKEMLTLHNSCVRVHVGCDEAWQLGRGRSGHDRHRLLLNHIVNLIHLLRSLKSNLTLMMWDDMLRDCDPELINTFIDSIDVELVVWRYNTFVEDIEKAISMYAQKGGLKRVWLATAFKGADDFDGLKPSIKARVDNHLAMRQLGERLKENQINVQGYILTGWQRFDHFAILCELLPVSIPSLICCIRALRSGISTCDLDNGKLVEEQRNINTILGVNNTDHVMLNNLKWTDLEFHLASSSVEAILDLQSKIVFPGSKLYLCVAILSGIRDHLNAFVRSQVMNTWCNEAMIRRGRVSRLQLTSIGANFKHIQDRLSPLLVNEIEKGLREVFNREEVIKEWIESHLDPIIMTLRDTETKLQRALSVCAK